MSKRKTKIPWHPAMMVALQLELEKYLDILHFEAEHQLTAQPLRIDVLIIRKDSKTRIDNSIAGIFRKVNIFEYKSPTDKLTVDRFYKGMVYAFMYKLLNNKKSNKLDIVDISLSFVTTECPKSVIAYIRQVWNGEISEPYSGISIIKGFPFPIQIIENAKISKENHLFLRVLNNNLNEDMLTFVLNEKHKPHKVDISPFVDVITRANPQRLKEVLMKNPTLEQVLDELGITARAEDRKAKEIAQNLIKKGWDSTEIAETTGLDLSTVQSLYGTVQT
ncbi:hypothetical protein ACYULU_01075 [Breznakiellaceae bacterium SP9]